MQAYVDAFDRAFERYKSQENRPGFSFGLFTRFRHKCAMYPHIQALREELNACQTAADAITVLNNYFNNPKTKYNHHSFANYLQEELVKAFPNGQWKKVDSCPVAFFQSVPGNNKKLLYRATRQPKEHAFVHGMAEGKHSEDLADYVAGSTYSKGVSTSKSYEGAYQYGVNEFIVVTPKGAIYREFSGVYIYVIDYRGLGGVDIDESLSLYKGLGVKLEKFEASGKQEVNVIGRIDPEDIVGAYELGRHAQGVFHRNPNYIPDRSLETANNKQERLAQLFTR